MVALCKDLAAIAASHRCRACRDEDALPVARKTSPETKSA
jgi:hypothetical protein